MIILRPEIIASGMLTSYFCSIGFTLLTKYADDAGFPKLVVDALLTCAKGSTAANIAYLVATAALVIKAFLPHWTAKDGLGLYSLLQFSLIALVVGSVINMDFSGCFTGAGLLMLSLDNSLGCYFRAASNALDPFRFLDCATKKYHSAMTVMPSFNVEDASDDCEKMP